MTELEKSRVNFHDKSKSQKIIGATLEHISNILKNCLGPYGSTTIIQERYTDHIITKDGYNIIKNIRFDHPISKTILDLIIKISRNQVRNVGDGSTSAIILANMLYKSIQRILSKYEISSKDIISMVKIIEEVLITNISDSAKKITEENLEDVIKAIATIANNNDPSIGGFISDIYKKHGMFLNINLSTHGKREDEYEVVPGFEHFRGTIHHVFLTDTNTKECVFEDPMIFLSENELGVDDTDVIVHLLNYCVQELKRPLVIVAKGYDHYMYTLLLSNKLKNKDNFIVCPIDMSVNTTERYDKYMDLVTYLGGQSYNKYDHLAIFKSNIDQFDQKFLGSCSTFICNELNSKFIKGRGSKKEITKRIESIEKDLQKHIETGDEIFEKTGKYYDYRRRIANLSSSMVNIKVGGSTDVERTTRQHLFEDAVYACQSAIQHGYVVGGNLITPKLLNEKDILMTIKSKINESIEVISKDLVNNNIVDELILSISDSFRRVFEVVLLNANLTPDDVMSISMNCVTRKAIYNIKHREYESDIITNIINSAETDIQIIKSCFSIISLVCTSNQFITIDEGYNTVFLENSECFLKEEAKSSV